MFAALADTDRLRVHLANSRNTSMLRLTILSLQETPQQIYQQTIDNNPLANPLRINISISIVLLTSLSYISLVQ
jgi:hypothetical protein